jgi:PQQ-dependent catabolism-associated CXXCW motif protein
LKVLGPLTVYVALAIVPAALAAAGGVLEPSGLREGPMHGETPDSLAGASVIGTDEVAELKVNAHPILLDVAEVDMKPTEVSKSMPWMSIHLSIPDADWLPGAGSGTTREEFGTAFKAHIAALTASDPDRPLIVFCHPQCWGSWNAAKRLVWLGYRHVFWYPDGVEGWQHKYDVEVAKEDLQWISLLRAATSQNPGAWTRRPAQ